ncbi:MAG: OmpA family protein [Proteobacteria bacterium]|nr:OmpA family protein [Pseudomonadota bacterium]
MRRIVVLLLSAQLSTLALAGCETDHYPQPRDWQTAPPPSRTAPPARPRTNLQMPPGKPGTAALAKADAYMDRQEVDLRLGLRNRGILVARQGDTLVLNMKSDTVFDTNSTAVSPQFAVILRGIANVIRYYDRTAIEVDGYTDTAGAPDQNMTVSQRRADAVAKALMAGGVNAKRVTAKGWGETRLKIPTGDNANEPRNRRVEIRIAPLLPA